MDPYQVVQCIAWYSFPSNGAGPPEWVDLIFHDAHPSYRAEKIRLAEKGFLLFYSALDSENKMKLVDAALAKYAVTP